MRTITRPPAGAGESRLTLAVMCSPTPTVRLVTLEMPGWVTVTVDDVPLIMPAALAVIWYWPAAVGRSAVTSLFVVAVAVELAGIVTMTELVEGVLLVLRVTIVDRPPVAGSIALKVTGMSVFALPQNPILGQETVAKINVSGADCVVRGDENPFMNSCGVSKVIVDVAERQVPSAVLAVSVTVSGLADADRPEIWKAVDSEV